MAKQSSNNKNDSVPAGDPGTITSPNSSVSYGARNGSIDIFYVTTIK